MILRTELPQVELIHAMTAQGDDEFMKFLGLGTEIHKGAQDVYADSAVSYAPFLTSWALERTFAENAARAFYTARNRPEDADAIDSTRVRAGTGASRIYTTP